jgi:zinc transport system substrate-binding protein
MASAMARALSEKDPANAAKYKANVERFSADLDTLSAELAAAVAPLKDKRYIVFHDAYQYFEDRFGLSPAGSIVLNPETAPGAKRLSEIQARIKETGAVCVFAEPQFEPRYVQTVLEGTKAKPGVLDGLGADIPAGPTAYQTLLRKFVGDLSSCLTKG